MEDVGYVRYIFKPKLIQRFNFGVREGGAVREVQLGGSRGQSKCTIQRTIQVHYTTIQVNASLALPHTLSSCLRTTS